MINDYVVHVMKRRNFRGAFKYCQSEINLLLSAAIGEQALEKEYRKDYYRI